MRTLGGTEGISWALGGPRFTPKYSQCVYICSGRTQACDQIIEAPNNDGGLFVKKCRKIWERPIILSIPYTHSIRVDKRETVSRSIYYRRRFFYNYEKVNQRWDMAKITFRNSINISDHRSWSIAPEFLVISEGTGLNITINPEMASENMPDGALTTFSFTTGQSPAKFCFQGTWLDKPKLWAPKLEMAPDKAEALDL